MCCDLGPEMSETSKRIVCDALGCDYDKCQWGDDGYGGGGYSGGYSGGGSSGGYSGGSSGGGSSGGYSGGYSGSSGGYSGGESTGGYSGSSGGYSGGGSTGGYSGSSGGYSGGGSTGGYSGGGSIEEVSSGRYYTGGGDSGGYSGGGYNSVKEYKIGEEIVKEQRTDKYTGEEPIEEYKEEEEPVVEYNEEEPIEEYMEEEEGEAEVVDAVKEDEAKIVAPTFITSKVEVETIEESYESACDDVSFFSFCLELFVSMQSHWSNDYFLRSMCAGCKNILLQSKNGHSSRENINLRPNVMCLAKVWMGQEEWVER